jgi:hypothetical protein
MTQPGDPPAGGLPIPGGVSERLWRDAALEAYQALHHPFVAALGHGVLPRCGACVRARERAPQRAGPAGRRPRRWRQRGERRRAGPGGGTAPAARGGLGGGAPLLGGAPSWGHPRARGRRRRHRGRHTTRPTPPPAPCAGPLPLTAAARLPLPPRECFSHYVAQDAHFLHFFARAYAAALDKCTDAAPEARVVLQQLLMGGARGRAERGGAWGPVHAARSWAPAWQRARASRARRASTDRQATHGPRPPLPPPPARAQCTWSCGCTAATRAAGASTCRRHWSAWRPPPRTTQTSSWPWRRTQRWGRGWRGGGAGLSTKRKRAPPSHVEARARGSAPPKPRHTHATHAAPAPPPQTTVAEVLAAMVPCSRLYAFLGVALAAAHPSRRGNPYADWISMYSGFEYLVGGGGGQSQGGGAGAGCRCGRPARRTQQGAAPPAAPPAAALRPARRRAAPQVLPMQKERLLDRLAGDAPYSEGRGAWGGAARWRSQQRSPAGWRAGGRAGRGQGAGAVPRPPHTLGGYRRLEASPATMHGLRRAAAPSVLRFARGSARAPRGPAPPGGESRRERARIAPPAARPRGTRPAPADRLRDLYRKAMQLEVAFFGAQPGIPAARESGGGRRGGRGGRRRRAALAPPACPEPRAAPAPQATWACWCATLTTRARRRTPSARC